MAVLLKLTSLFCMYLIVAGNDADSDAETATSYNPCPEGYFYCNPNCVPDYYVCDGVYNCANHSDETNCDVSSTSGGPCGEDHFECSDGICIPDYWVCDQIQDCSNDEQYCTSSSANPTTSPPISYPPTTTSVPSNCRAPYILVGNRCLFFEIFQAGTYGEMNYRCQQLAGKPISIDDANDLYDIYQFANASDFQASFWLEGYKAEGKEEYFWRSTESSVKMGTPFWANKFSSYGDPEGQYPSPTTYEMCIYMDKEKNYYFMSSACSSSFGIICERAN